MVIIQLAGGLGNQMFQYALYLQLKSQGRTVKIDDVSGFAAVSRIRCRTAKGRIVVFLILYYNFRYFI